MADEVNYQLTADVKIRQGVYSNCAFITSQPKEDRIDFAFIDDASEGNASGIVVARVILSRPALIELRDAITMHLSRAEEELDAD